MSCPAAIALLCLDLAGVYIDGGLTYADSGVERYAIVRNTHFVESNGTIQTGHSEYTAFDHRAQNPYGRLAVGYEQTFFVPNLRLSAELYHESSLATASDRGVNGARISLRWYPFGGAQ